MSKVEEQIKKTQEQIKQLENKKKVLLSKQREEERKKRNHRLIERGAILESIIGVTDDVTNEQLKAFLIEVFADENVKYKTAEFKRATAESVQSLV